MPALDNMQGIMTQRIPKLFTVTLLFTMPDPGAGRAFLSAWRASVPSAAMQDDLAKPSMCFALSWDCMARLLAGHPGLDAESGAQAFEWTLTDPRQRPEGPALREQLGFVGPNDPAHWWDGAFTGRDIDIAVIAGFPTGEDKDAGLARLRASAAEAGLKELRVPCFADGALSAYRPQGGFLHFGYRDGITAPAVDWEDSGAPGLVDPREFVVGYPSADYPTAPQHPGPWRDFARDGSYLALTWIYQDVARFNAFLTANAGPGTDEASRAARELLAAKLMGRWRDGTPLMHHPVAPPASPEPRDDFSYAADPKGEICPVNAHIRVVNPRDQPLSFPNQSRFPKGPPRLLRRGGSYGPPLDGEVDDGVDRGVLGAFICARLNEQFYSVVRWMQKTDFADAFGGTRNGFHGQDLLCGSRTKPGAKVTARLLPGQESPARVEDFIRFKGVAPLFLPSLSGLAQLSSAPGG